MAASVTVPSQFSASAIEGVCKVLADAVTGPQIPNLIAPLKVPEEPDRPGTKWKRLFNAVALCQSGRVVGRRHKSLLPTYDVFDEDRYFEPARAVSPLDLHGRRVGVTICEDVWNDKDFHRWWCRGPRRQVSFAALS